MLDVEEQIHRLADASFDATVPVVFVPGAAPARSPRTRYLAVAAALLCVIGLGGLIAIANTRSTTNTDVVRYQITDPLTIDLDEAIASSEQLRIAAIGPLLTFDFEQLPAGWEARVNHTTTTPGSGDGAEYWQQVEVLSPSRVALVVNIWGRLDQDAAVPAPADPDTQGELVDVRGQPARQTFSTLSWAEQDQTRVEIGAQLNGLDVRAETLELAELLEPIRTELDWLAEPQIGIRLIDAQTLLAGTLANTKWQLLSTPVGLALGIGDDSRASSEGEPVQESDRQIGYSIASVSTPGGAVVYGDAPALARGVQLRTDTAIIEVPTAPAPDGRVAFAVPIDDRLDPLGIDFLDDSGQVLATIPLDDLPPFFGGGLRSSVDI